MHIAEIYFKCCDIQFCFVTIQSQIFSWTTELLFILFALAIETKKMHGCFCSPDLMDFNDHLISTAMNETKWFAFIAICKKSHDTQITQYHCVQNISLDQIPCICCGWILFYPWFKMYFSFISNYHTPKQRKINLTKNKLNRNIYIQYFVITIILSWIGFNIYVKCTILKTFSRELKLNIRERKDLRNIVGDRLQTNKI